MPVPMVTILQDHPPLPRIPEPLIHPPGTSSRPLIAPETIIRHPIPCCCASPRSRFTGSRNSVSTTDDPSKLEQQKKTVGGSLTSLQSSHAHAHAHVNPTAYRKPGSQGRARFRSCGREGRAGPGGQRACDAGGVGGSRGLGIGGRNGRSRGRCGGCNKRPYLRL